MIDPTKIYDHFEKNKGVYKKTLDRVSLKKAIPFLEEFTETAYQKNNCLECAGCCKNYSPRFKAPDIKRISKYIGMKETEMMDKFLHRDDEGDYVLNEKPCTFLNQDNTCSIYEVRPSDCARFPYTDEDVFLKRKDLTIKNASFCVIAQHVLERLKDVK
ncbi:MAG: YkgJ family cysteine cluster protein [Saprospiraceae bacterium]